MGECEDAREPHFLGAPLPGRRPAISQFLLFDLILPLLCVCPALGKDRYSGKEHGRQ